ncbi:glycerophosphodiester phosphodiesterase [Flavobacterium sp.]|uniref:glycerophosphodiester phosphodiesterase n=1 Tax=Flavobacterium sp. TaxID=239 RepID=UPI003D0A0C65
MLNIGHRGAKGHVAENTMESFLKAFELGADGIELDIHLTADGEAVVIHDETVDRTIKNASGFIKDFTVADCSKVGIPTLVEVFHVLPEDAFLNIEIKNPEATLVVADEIEKFVRLGEIHYENVLVSSFHWEVLGKLSQINPDIRLGVLSEENSKEALAFAKEIEAYSVNVWFELLTPELIALARQHQIQVHTFTVNSPEDITFAKKMGVDAIITDYPDRV